MTPAEAMTIPIETAEVCCGCRKRLDGSRFCPDCLAIADKGGMESGVREAIRVIDGTIESINVVAEKFPPYDPTARIFTFEDLRDSRIELLTILKREIVDHMHFTWDIQVETPLANAMNGGNGKGGNE